jgi:cytochrome c biogenesis protein CcmG, thiol:disulfide interchange protein DsbE
VLIGVGIVGVAAALIGAELLSGSSNGSRTGRPAPELPASVLVPPKVTLDALRGKPAVVNFWASWCDPCRKEASAMERVSRSLHGRARIVGVDWTDGTESARSYIRQYGWSFPILRDPGGAVGTRYGIQGLPTTFVLDSRGRISDILRGPQSVGSLRQAIRRAS